MRRTVAALVVLLAALAAAQPALGARQVTIAARYCPSYASITANEARNNIQESLQDLGADTPYGPVDSMDPDIEEANQPACSPLAGWRFTLGTGVSGTKLPGVWGNLSQVATPFPTAIATVASTPLLNTSGESTGRTIHGAVTIALTDAQSDLAARGALWIMGGTPTAPVAEPETYAFGALRCAVDNLNGDNVEYVSLPNPTSHAFCFAYYVRPAPTSGTIIVRKRMEVPPGVPAPPPQTVPFTGNVSYAPDPDHPNDPNHNVFTVRSGVSSAAVEAGQTTFYRAAGTMTWGFAEQAPPAGTEFAGVSCTKNGASSVTTDQGARSAAVLLAPSDVVVCTFTNRVTPKGKLVVRKVTFGDVGSFTFTVNGRPSLHATTTEEGVPAASPDQLDPGVYKIAEEPKPSARGTWKLESLVCGDHEISPPSPAAIVVPAAGTICTYTNRFTPKGEIRIRKATRGALATTGFVIAPDFDPPTQYLQTATTTQIGVPVLASGDDTTALPLGRYVIRELTPSAPDVPGSWRLASAVCDGAPVATAEGAGTVTLTANNPTVDCTVVDEFVPEPEPPLPPTPTPPPGPTPLPGPGIEVAGIEESSDPTPEADLVVTKRAIPARVRLGARVRYVVTVRNRGPATARAVTVVERGGSSRARLDLRPSQGRCRGAPPRFCVIGALAPGASATVRVTVRAVRLGRVRNVVAVNTATRTLSLRRQRATATVLVVPRPRAQFTG